MNFSVPQGPPSFYFAVHEAAVHPLVPGPRWRHWCYGSGCSGQAPEKPTLQANRHWHARLHTTSKRTIFFVVFLQWHTAVGLCWCWFINQNIMELTKNRINLWFSSFLVEFNHKSVSWNILAWIFIPCQEQGLHSKTRLIFLPVPFSSSYIYFTLFLLTCIKKRNTPVHISIQSSTFTKQFISVLFL